MKICYSITPTKYKKYLVEFITPAVDNKNDFDRLSLNYHNDFLRSDVYVFPSYLKCLKGIIKHFFSRGLKVMLTKYEPMDKSNYHAKKE